MKLEGVIHCEGPDCEAHSHVGAQSMGAKRLPPGWCVFREFGDGGVLFEHAFHTGDCAFKWLGGWTKPPEIISFDDVIE